MIKITNNNLRYWLPILIVPTIAIIIVVRQYILQHTQNLSIWKGGGMGMFASSDVVTRFTKIYIVPSPTVRYPVVRFTPTQIKLRRKVKYHPNDNNLKLLAKNIAKTQWVAGTEKFAHIIIDRTGKQISKQQKKYHYVRPFGPRPDDTKRRFKVLIEYWETNYDVNTRSAKASIKKVFTLGEE